MSFSPTILVKTDLIPTVTTSENILKKLAKYSNSALWANKMVVMPVIELKTQKAVMLRSLNFNIWVITGIMTPIANKLNNVPVLCTLAIYKLKESVPSSQTNLALAYWLLILEIPLLAKLYSPKRLINIITTCLTPPGLLLKATPKLSMTWSRLKIDPIFVLESSLDFKDSESDLFELIDELSIRPRSSLICWVFLTKSNA